MTLKRHYESRYNNMSVVCEEGLMTAHIRVACPWLSAL